MSYLNFLTPIAAGDPDWTKFAKLQAQLHLAVVNAGISIPMSNPFLTDIVTGEPDLSKWQKLGAWTGLLASNISGGGGGGSNVPSALTPITAGTSSLAVVFATPFTGAPSVVANLIPPGGGAPILVNPTSVTAAGFTANWGFAIPAGYSLAWMAVNTSQ